MKEEQRQKKNQTETVAKTVSHATVPCAQPQENRPEQQDGQASLGDYQDFSPVRRGSAWKRGIEAGATAGEVQGQAPEPVSCLDTLKGGCSVEQIRLNMSGGRTTMDRITENLLSEFSKHNQIENLKESKQFEHFAAYITTKKHYPQSFDTSELVTGKGDDIGIDSISILVNGQLVTDEAEMLEQASRTADLDVTFIFVQAETSSSFEAAKIGTFGFGVADFFKEVPKLPRNELIETAARIQSVIYDFSNKFRRQKPLCRLYYVTTGKWLDQPALVVRSESVKSDLMETGMFREVEFIPVGSENVQKYYRQATNGISREFDFPKKISLPKMQGVKESYVGYLPALEYLSIIRDDDGSVVRGLFYDNVRDWLDSNDVNDEIRASIASDDKERFALMNNGVTIIARTCITTGDKVYIEHFSIVNGCQTSHSLHEESEHLDSTVMVPIRLICTQDDQIINSIIRATNRQTQVSEEQFFALEEFSKELEEYFNAFQGSKRLYYERRTDQFSSASVEKTRRVSPANMIKAYAAMFLREPLKAAKDYAALKASVGKDIFAKGQRMEAYYVAAFTLYKLEFLFRNSRLSPKFKPAKFNILMAVPYLVKPGHLPPDNSHELRRLCESLMETLGDPTLADELIFKAARAIYATAKGNLDRDAIRTQDFTNKLVAELSDPAKIADGWSSVVLPASFSIAIDIDELLKDF